MNMLFNLLHTKTKQALRTDEERLKVHAEVARTKYTLDAQFESLSKLLDAALVRLKDQQADHPPHPNKSNK
jgi:hypothetical protein